MDPQTLVAHPVDLEGWWEGGDVERRQVAAAIDAACRDTGFLLLAGHRVPAPVIERWVEACDEFFALPLDEKLAARAGVTAGSHGYTAPGDESLAYSRNEPTPPDLVEAISFGREDIAGPAFAAYPDWFSPNHWPARPAGLRAAFVDYEAHLRRVSDAVLGAMAVALDLPEDWLVERCADAVITTRALRYERAPGAPDPLPRQMRLGAHTDYGVCTLLWADDAPGLQIFSDGVWHDVTVPPGLLLGNIGDMLTMWTNGRWRSTLHRVVPPPAGTGPARRRSVARFLDGYPGTVVECIPSCATADNPPRFPPVRAGEWLAAKIDATRTAQEVDLPDTVEVG